MPDCATCVSRAVTRSDDILHQTCGDTVRFDGYFVKYDNATFLDVKDNSSFQKMLITRLSCHTCCDYLNISNEPEFMERAEAVHHDFEAKNCTLVVSACSFNSQQWVRSPSEVLELANIDVESMMSPKERVGDLVVAMVCEIRKRDSPKSTVNWWCGLFK
ncbi:hypothetical protein Fmac_013071 [Flemingia macrophylla]|uniref:Uncharacterized protein n=1 Tax=Flemingia macrophylla TaxID=520843 RepID=A0ABD1MS41_9FABA